MKINHSMIGDGNKTFVIAEVGSNYKRDINLAFEHIDAAHQAGADAVKFQSLKMDKLYKTPSDAVKLLYEKIDLEESLHERLKSYADNIGITFFSSPTYLDAVDLLDKLNVDLFKIASAQVGTFPRLIDRVAKTGRATIFSTGLADYEKLARTVNIFENNNNTNYAILHCNSMYPTPYDKVFLERIAVYKKMFSCPVGFSDHTEGVAIILAAVALKANIIEKHFKLDKVKNTPDADFSIGTNKFSEMVRSIRAIEDACCNEPRNYIEPSERKFLEDISYKLFLKNTKRVGDKLALSDFEYLRDENGIDVSLDEFIADNFCMSSSVKKGDLLVWGDLQGRCK